MTTQSSSRSAERRLTAFLDGPDSPDINNPIHSTAVANEYGFKAALVGGVTVYGWAAPPILEVLGEEWLRDGWVDVSFRKPTYPGDDLTVRAGVTDDGTVSWDIMTQEGTASLAGLAGRGKAPWLGELLQPTRVKPELAPDPMPSLTLENAPIGKDLTPMAVPFSIEEAEEYCRVKQVDSNPRWYGPNALVHPGWIAGRMTRLLHHSYHYSPAIHTRSQIQHLAPFHAGQTVTVAGTFRGTSERKGNHHCFFDAVILGENGDLLVQLRHSTIFHVAKRA